jgi:hypothetical protein
MYRCVTTSIEGFVQQVACSYLVNGYVFYVRGAIPAGKDPAAVDAKLIKKYRVDRTKWQRSVDAQEGIARMQYIRHDRTFLLMATHGKHEFFEKEGDLVRDARKVPIRFAGYSISYRRGQDGKYHPHVRIDKEQLATLKQHFRQRAMQASAEQIGLQLGALPFEPYAPVRRQLLELHRLINRHRNLAGLALVPHTILRYRRRIVRPFSDGTGLQLQ